MIFRYLFTPIVIYLSFFISAKLFTYLLPFVVEFGLYIRGDGGFWAILGRWGALFIITFLGGISLFIHIFPTTLLGNIIRSVSPNTKFTTYSCGVVGLLCTGQNLYALWIDASPDFFGIIQTLIFSIFLIIIMLMVSMTAIEESV